MTTLVTTKTEGGSLRNNYTGKVGFKFKVQTADMTVTALGRAFYTGNSGSHTLSIYRVSDNQLMASVSVSFTSGNPASGEFKYVNLSTPVKLYADEEYYLVSDETNAGDQWRDLTGTTITTTSAGASESAVNGDGVGWSVSGTAGQTFGPLDLKYDSPQAPTGEVSGLILKDYFRDETVWSRDEGWYLRELPSLVAFDRSPVKALAPTAGTSNTGGVREGHLFVDSDGTWYLYYGAGDGTQPWYIQCDYSTDRAVTWIHQGDIGILYKKTNNPADGNWAARDMLYMEKRGSVYIMHAMSALTVFDTVIPNPNYESDIWTASSPLGPWTWVRRAVVKGASGDFDGRDAYSGSVVFYQGTYYLFYSAVDASGVNYQIGISTATDPLGPFVKAYPSVLPVATKGNPENPKVFWHTILKKWVMLFNRIGNDPVTGYPNTNGMYVSDSLTDWSHARFIVLQHPSGSDGFISMGIPGPFYAPEGVAVFDNGFAPFTFDTDSSGDGVAQNLFRTERYGVLEPSRCALSHRPTIAFSDNFNRSDRSLAGDNGWSLAEGATGFSISGNSLAVGTSGTDSAVMVNSAHSLADGLFAVTASAAAEHCEIGLVLRYQSATSYYLFTFAGSGGVWQVTAFLKTGAGFTSLGSFTSSLAFTANVSRRVSVFAEGSKFRLYVDDLELGVITDTSITAAGLAGLRRGGAGTSARTADDFSVTQAVIHTARRTLAHSDFVSEFALDFEGVTGGGWASFDFRRQQSGDCYRLVIRAGGRLELQKLVSGVVTVLQSNSTGQQARLLRSQRLRLEITGTALRAWLDGEQQIGVFDSTFATGTEIGFSASCAAANVRLLQVRTGDDVWLLNLTPGQRVVLRCAGVPYRTAIAEGNALRVSLRHYPLDEIEVGGVSLLPEGGITGGDSIDARPYTSRAAPVKVMAPAGTTPQWFTSGGTLLISANPRVEYTEGTASPYVFVEDDGDQGQITVEAEDVSGSRTVYNLRCG